MLIAQDLNRHNFSIENQNSLIQSLDKNIHTTNNELDRLSDSILDVEDQEEDMASVP